MIMTLSTKFHRESVYKAHHSIITLVEVFLPFYINLMRKKREKEQKREIFFKPHHNHETSETHNNNETLFFFFFFFFARGVQKLLSLTRVGVRVIFYHRFCESL